MKKIVGILFSSLLLLFLSACEKDGNLYTISGLEDSELMATASDLVLSLNASDSVVVTFAWTASNLTVSDTSMSVPDGVLSNTLQAAVSSDFSTSLVESAEESLSKAFTGAEMNTLASTLGLTANTPTPIYFRMKTSVGNNMEPLYSNVVTINVTPYDIDFTIGRILNSAKEETGVALHSFNEDGVYTGFMGATAWYNFYLQEGDNTTWGNDGVSGTPFLLSSENDAALRWNCWFPGVGGCYYVEVNANTKRWSALLLPSLSVTGDIQGVMTFDRPNTCWTMSFEATSTSMNIQLKDTGNLYNYTTGTDDAAVISTPMGFTGTADSMLFANVAQNLTITVPTTGTYTLVVNLDSTAWTVEAVQGTQEPEPVNPLLYLPGVDDGISGSWTFDNTLKLYNEDNLTYAGVVNVNSLWGYSINIEKDNWDDKYTMDTGDAYAGTLVYKGSTNLPAPTVGLYLFDVSVKALTYKLDSLENLIYISGLNNVWDFSTSLTETATPGEFSGTVTISLASDWGFKIYLINNDWNLFYGGSEGNLVYKGSNITDDASLAAGSYTMTVNLVAGTYSFIAI